ncbi:hypothetical protein EYC80_009700 [Monilinia laxa]|uniref:Uncharacterized protein n=1 Tax=Monilinia laxa TaxID=61186 RepID=A0A5N6JYN3_MONLA|nr:hypothetical protein EYC80_009700 [Monilinia laxa]
MTSNLSTSTDITNEHDSASQASKNHSQQPLKTRICRYFSKSGNCRAGDSCSFIHDPTKLPSRGTANKTMPEVSQASISEGTQGGQDMNQNHSSQAVTNPVPASRVVAKPVPQAQTENPREFQLGQIRRRFSPKEIRPTGNAEGTTILRFNLTPSDPDFPFEMTALECSLTIPPRYPTSPPTLRVENKDIPRGFAINVENGFDSLVREKENATLLDLMKSLDKHLEEFLSAQKVETVKIVMNKDTRHLSIPSREVQPMITPPQPESTVKDLEQPKVTPSKPIVSFTDSEKSEASKRREIEIRQLEARMGRLPLFKKSSDGIAYTIPIEPRKRGELPSSIKAVKAIQLFVPTIYPLEPCRIKLERVDAPEATSVEKAFVQKVEEAKALNLMGHINYLAQNMHILAKTVVKMEPKIVPILQTPPPVEKPKDVKGKGVATEESEEKSHIQYIARPPEWTIVNTEDAEYSDSDSMYSYDSGDESESEEGGVEVENEPETSAHNPERGTAISFPFIELYGIELFEITTLNITVKCSRCREMTEIKGLKTGVSKTETCRKCATALIICYRRDLVHAHNVRAGFLDLEGCVIGDMLPSSFTPTCSTCSTIYPAPGIVSIRGETTTNVCRECHSKFTFSIPTIKFLQISSSATPHNLLPRKKKETFGIVPGTPLPKNGLCRHYGKSYRWFRFSCCEKVYACDKCHDEKEEHVNEWAKRMICGWCSREGSYRPEDCAACGERVISRRRGGASFWEGGKGTRDKTRMSRKDKRKYRRIGGGVKKT